VTSKLSEYSGLLKSFKKFFGPEDLRLQLKNKAEIQALNDIKIQKLDRDEFQSAVAYIGSIDEKIKHLS